jgi:hypothetical protein
VKEAAIVAGLDVYGIENVQEVIDSSKKEGLWNQQLDNRHELSFIKP